MTLEEITSELKSAETPPADTLRAGLGEADQLAPAIFALADKFCEGTYLLPEERRLLHYGLTILGAAKQAGLYAHLLKLSRQPEEELEQLFPHRITDSFVRLLLSAWDGSSDPIFAAIEDKELAFEVRSAWFGVLARLTFDGVIPRERTLAFLARLEREGAIEDGDMAWWGWEEAVIWLGATELEPALKRVWTKVIFEQHKPEEHEESLALLHRAASDPANPAIFEKDEVCAISDPAEALAWIGPRRKAMEDWGAEDSQPDGDPAQSIRLSDEEMEWLSGFLASRQAPESTMAFETLDGFFTALVIGPEMVMPSVYLPAIWGTKDGSGPVWDSLEQLQYFMGLLTKHWNAISARRNADAPHRPEIDYFADGAQGQGWAQGFTEGMHLCGEAWDPLVESDGAGELVLHIMALALDSSSILPHDTRSAILDNLPDMIREIAAYWHNAPAAPVRKAPIRQPKTGRNEPCPCGSGRKYKKCCGTTSPPTLH